MFRPSSFWAVSLVVGLFIPQAAGRPQSAADSAGVRAAHERWFAGILGDRAVLSDVLAPEVTLRFPGGNQMPRSQFLKLLQSGELSYNSAQHSETNIRSVAGVLKGDFAPRWDAGRGVQSVGAAHGSGVTMIAVAVAAADAVDRSQRAPNL